MKETGRYQRIRGRLICPTSRLLSREAYFRKVLSSVVGALLRTRSVCDRITLMQSNKAANTRQSPDEQISFLDIFGEEAYHTPR